MREVDLVENRRCFQTRIDTPDLRLANACDSPFLL